MAPRRHSRPSPTLNSPIAVKQEAVEDARLALALQKPEMELTNGGAGAGTIEVSFVTGPQAPGWDRRNVEGPKGYGEDDETEGGDAPADETEDGDAQACPGAGSSG